MLRDGSAEKANWPPMNADHRGKDKCKPGLSIYLQRRPVWDEIILRSRATISPRWIKSRRKMCSAQCRSPLTLSISAQRRCAQPARCAIYSRSSAARLQSFARVSVAACSDYQHNHYCQNEKQHQTDCIQQRLFSVDPVVDPCSTVSTPINLIECDAVRLFALRARSKRRAGCAG